MKKLIKTRWGAGRVPALCFFHFAYAANNYLMEFEAASLADERLCFSGCFWKTAMYTDKG